RTQPGPLVERDPVGARPDHGGPPAALSAPIEESRERVADGGGIADGVAGRETGAVHVPVRDRGASVGRGDVALVVTESEGVERVAVRAVRQTADAIALDGRRDGAFGDGR